MWSFLLNTTYKMMLTRSSILIFFHVVCFVHSLFLCGVSEVNIWEFFRQYSDFLIRCLRNICIFFNRAFSSKSFFSTGQCHLEWVTPLANPLKPLLSGSNWCVLKSHPTLEYGILKWWPLWKKREMSNFTCNQFTHRFTWSNLWQNFPFGNYDWKAKNRVEVCVPVQIHSIGSKSFDIWLLVLPS